MPNCVAEYNDRAGAMIYRAQHTTNMALMVSLRYFSARTTHVRSI